MSNFSIQSDLWESVKNNLRNSIPEDVFNTWFSDLSCAKAEDGKIVLNAPNEFAALWIESNYMGLLGERINMAAGRRVHVSIETCQNASAEAEQLPKSETGNRFQAEKPVQKKNSPGTQQFVLNPKHTFEHFVVGKSNEHAHAAAMGVARVPGHAYNPFFIYGGTGLGKTHLMQAIAHSILQSKPHATIAYVSSEKFFNEYINAIQENSFAAFRKNYRSVDILLIDDIQFLSGKQACQEEFFHTFNDLYERGSQIVLASDRPPVEISKLSERLISRFQWGLTVDIQIPDFETRLAILQKKAKSLGVYIKPEIIDFLAERITCNIRSLEGALTRISSFAQIFQDDRHDDLEYIERMLADILQDEARSKVTIQIIQEKVAERYGLQLADMSSKRRPAKIALPRQIAMYLCRQLTSHSLQEIGEAFGGRDHGTVIHACKSVENIIEQKPDTRLAIQHLVNKLSR